MKERMFIYSVLLLVLAVCVIALEPNKGLSLVSSAEAGFHPPMAPRNEAGMADELDEIFQGETHSPGHDHVMDVHRRLGGCDSGEWWNPHYKSNWWYGSYYWTGGCSTCTGGYFCPGNGQRIQCPKGTFLPRAISGTLKADRCTTCSAAR